MKPVSIRQLWYLTQVGALKTNGRNLCRKAGGKGICHYRLDASYQGESGGEPRQLENPYIVLKTSVP